MEEKALDSMLFDAIDKFRLEVSKEEVANDFRIYKELLLDYNSHTNLTAITDEKEIYIKHFIDSISTFLAFEFLEKNFNINISASKIIDIGAGAGFPSMPIKIINKNLDITMLDSLAKRTKFLELLSKELNIHNINILHKRAEDCAREKDKRESFDIVLSRAVANLPVLLEYSIPFIKKGGFMICLKGPLANEEIIKSKNALKLLGGEVLDIISVDIPFSELHHKIVIIKKIKNTDKKYPRKAGTPTKEPL